MMNDRRRVERLFEELEAECGTSVEVPRPTGCRR